MPENVIYKAAQRSRPICATCKRAALFQEPIEAKERLVYGICFAKGRDIAMLWSGCPAYAPAESRSLSPAQTAALLLHTLHLYDGYGSGRLTRLAERAAALHAEMRTGTETTPSFSAEELVKKYQEVIDKLI